MTFKQRAVARLIALAVDHEAIATLLIGRARRRCLEAKHKLYNSIPYEAVCGAVSRAQYDRRIASYGGVTFPGASWGLNDKTSKPYHKAIDAYRTAGASADKAKARALPHLGEAKVLRAASAVIAALDEETIAIDLDVNDKGSILARCANISARNAARTPGLWRWWTSNSYRRLSSSLTGPDGNVAHAFTNHHDRVPDIAISDSDMAFIETSAAEMPWLMATLLEVLAERDRLMLALNATNVDAAVAMAAQIIRLRAERDAANQKLAAMREGKPS